MPPLVTGQNKKSIGQHHREDNQEQVFTGKEDPAGKNHKYQEKNDERGLGAMRNQIFLAEQFRHIVERLQNRWTDAPLHARRDPAVDAGQQPSEQGSENNI